MKTNQKENGTQKTDKTHEVNVTHVPNKTHESNGTQEVIDYSKMSKDEIIAELNKVQTKLKSGQTSKKDQVMDCLENGIQTIQDVAKELNISDKNVSSNLTYLREDLKKDGKTIISFKNKDNRKTYLKVMSFSELGWNF